MSRDNGAIIVRGLVLGIEHKSGVSAKSGEPWAFDLVSVLTGKQVSEIRWSDKMDALPKEDEFIAVEVSLDVFNNRQQIEAQKRVDPALSVVKSHAAS